MTRKDILKKYGFSWMSNVNLKEELSEQAAAEFEDLIRTLANITVDQHLRHQDGRNRCTTNS